MHSFKTGVPAREIMDENFLIIDSSLPLMKCVKEMNHTHEACFVLKDGNFFGIAGNEDIIKGVIRSKSKNPTLKDIILRKNFAIVSPGSDVFKSLLLLKQKNIDFVVVRGKGRILGLITKKEIANIASLLLENFDKRGGL